MSKDDDKIISRQLILARKNREKTKKVSSYRKDERNKSLEEKDK